MTNEKKTAVVQTLAIGQMASAEVIPGTPLRETASGIPPIRTVVTTMTTGNVSIRYVPRTIQFGGKSDTGGGWRSHR